MKPWLMCALTFLLASSAAIAADSQKKLSAVEKLPEGLAAPIAAVLNPKGFSVTGASGAVCDVWFVKELPLKPDFKATLNVKYPLTPGTLVGALRVAEKSEFTDFRGTPIAAGVYTLRYGQQPQDGNHLGTSDVSDFLLALSAKTDADPKPIAIVKELHKISAKASGTTHPAILLLLPPDEASEKPALTHEEDRDLWILSVTADGKDGDKNTRVPFRLVAIGKSEG